MRNFLLLFFCIAFGIQANAQCDQSEVIISITTDAYPSEISWTLSDVDGNEIQTESLAGEGTNTTIDYVVCVDSLACLNFLVEDSFGDGINAPGGFEVILDGVSVIQTVAFSSSYTASFNCPPGTSCNSSEPVGEGDYQTIYDDHWYLFVPDSSGIYNLTTCGLTTCDTKIWVYDNCGGFDGIEDNTGTLFYDDNFGSCGEQANLLVGFEVGQNYYIRIGDDTDACGDIIDWSLHFNGQISGCTDPNSCNYNPLAVIDDGSCIPFGDPLCPQGPDLLMDEARLRSSMYLTTIDNSDDCLINEGCLQGYGMRDIIRFSTRIDNIGELDYFIGLEGDQNGQFTYDNCHNHWHYDGYAEYLLYDAAGQEIPIGFKNGFCVLDLGCTTGTPQYTCNNMGIASGCYDEYWAELECQWVDITDVPDGDYILVTRVNWDNAPDALGRMEKDSINNWAQACINIDRSSGAIAFEQYTDCDAYRDCTGELYGDAQIDCKGVCNGPALMGDVDEDLSQSAMDLDLYAQGIISGDLTTTPCNDLTEDGFLDIYDLTLFASCLNFGANHVHQDNGPHDHCKFPRNINANDELATLEIVDFDPNSHIDIAMKNESSQVIGYQFTVSGITISAVENLMDTTEYNHPVMMDPVTNMVMSYATDDQFIERNTEQESIVRVYFSDVTQEEICIENIVGIINEKLERVDTGITGNCVAFSSTQQTNALTNLAIFPNPTAQFTTVKWESNSKVFGWELTNLRGQRMMESKEKNLKVINLDLNSLSPGVYILKLRSENGLSLAKIVKQ